jgi:restriction-modification enzyme MmeI-like protein
MKKGGENLHLHVRQAFEYWVNAVPNRPRYVVLCNFNEFWIYDFDRQLDEPVDRVTLQELPKRYTAFNFLFPVERKPQFNNDRDEMSREAGDKMAELFKRLTRRLKKYRASGAGTAFHSSNRSRYVRRGHRSTASGHNQRNRRRLPSQQKKLV